MSNHGQAALQVPAWGGGEALAEMLGGRVAAGISGWNELMLHTPSKMTPSSIIRLGVLMFP